MKKSLVVLTVILASLAVAGMAFAAGKAVCPPPMKCELGTNIEQGAPKIMLPKRGVGGPPKCVTMPCPQIPVTIPGKPYAIANLPVNVWIKDTAPVFRNLCEGKCAGAAPAFCGPCAPLIKWDCSWNTREECGKVAYKFCIPPGRLVRRPASIQVTEKMVPIQPECLW